jgi:hypothetical protein
MTSNPDADQAGPNTDGERVTRLVEDVTTALDEAKARIVDGLAAVAQLDRILADAEDSVEGLRTQAQLLRSDGAPSLQLGKARRIALLINELTRHGQRALDLAGDQLLQGAQALTGALDPLEDLESMPGRRDEAGRLGLRMADLQSAVRFAAQDVSEDRVQLAEVQRMLAPLVNSQPRTYDRHRTAAWIDATTEQVGARIDRVRDGLVGSEGLDVAWPNAIDPQRRADVATAIKAGLRPTSSTQDAKSSSVTGLPGSHRRDRGDRGDDRGR